MATLNKSLLFALSFWRVSIQAMEKRDNGVVWKSVNFHVESVVAELQATRDADMFDSKGMTVLKHTTDASVVMGSIVDVDAVEDDEGESSVVCAVRYEDGSTELFLFHEARDRIAEAGGGDDTAKSSS